MEKIIRWFVSNKVVSNLLMVLILITGATTIPNLKMEVFPEIELNIINVTTAVSYTHLTLPTIYSV